MGRTLNEIAEELKNNKKVQLIYAFNATGKTRLSKEFKELIDPKVKEEDIELIPKRFFITMRLQKIYFIGITI